jgi:hypothetical protein
MESEIIIPRFISRKFIQAHRELIFLYGYDKQHKGIFGQAFECHNEENTYPIYTCWKMCATSRYFQDSQYENLIKILDDCVAKIPRDKPIIPLPKIGEGFSRMNEHAPKTFLYMRKLIDSIKYTNLKIDYYG